MRERPIIMSVESVRAILDGRKTQTRRACKPQPVLPEGQYRYDGRHEHIQNGAPAVELLDSNGEPTERYFGCRIPRFEPGDRVWVKEQYRHRSETHVKYRADRENTTVHWNNPMFMPRKFSRITLKVIDVRLERLMKITVKDLYDEGFHTGDEFIRQWDTLNAKRGFPASSNPFVWVIEFRRIETCYNKSR